MSIDYLKLVRTASRTRTAGPPERADRVLHAVVWWGAVANFLLSIAIGVTLAIMAPRFDEMVAFLPAVAPVPVLIYYSFWLWTMSDVPRLSRMMIGIPSFLLSALIVYLSFIERYPYWFTLIPLFCYFAAVAYVALEQTRYPRARA